MPTILNKLQKREKLSAQKKRSHFTFTKPRPAMLVIALVLISAISLPYYLVKSGQAAAATTKPVAIGGISDPDLINETPAVQASQLADMKTNLHVTTVRVDANWGWVQYGGPTSYDWSQYDPLVASIRAAGLGIDFVIDGCPAWAATVPGDVSAAGDAVQPTNPAQYGAWAATIASRYGSGGATSYEIWNEPNLTQSWLPAANPAAYTADLKAAYSAIKAVQPNQMVVSAGLAPAADDSQGDIAPVQFLSSIYADGGKNSFNAVGYHPYSYPALPNTYETWSGFSQMSATNPSIRSVMVANGDSAKQVWITEIGWPTNTATLSGIDGYTAQSDEVAQVSTFAGANSWVGPIYWYSYQDDNGGPFGLVGQKPSYAAFAGS